MSQTRSDNTPTAEQLKDRLSRLIKRHCPGNADSHTDIPGLAIFNRIAPDQACPCLYEPGLIVLSQGAKRMQIDNQSHRYDANHFLLTSLPLPASSQVLEASPEEPMLGLALRLDRQLITEQLTRMRNFSAALLQPNASCATTVPISEALLDPLVRLLALEDDPASIGILAPLIVREIHYRLLTSPAAPLLAQFAKVGSFSGRITDAIDWLRDNFDQPMRVDALARNLGMSSSSLHHHFRQLTGRSPLQYQKWLRINEARRLMLNEHLDVASACYKVGYESPSQFSRDYRRLFGVPPKRDIVSLSRSSLAEAIED